MIIRREENITKNVDKNDFFINFISKDEKVFSEISKEFRIDKIFRERNINLKNCKVGSCYIVPKFANFCVYEKNQEIAKYSDIENCMEEFVNSVVKFRKYFPYNKIKIPIINIIKDDEFKNDLDFLYNRATKILRTFDIQLIAYKV